MQIRAREVGRMQQIQMAGNVTKWLPHPIMAEDTSCSKIDLLHIPQAMYTIKEDIAFILYVMQYLSLWAWSWYNLYVRMAHTSRTWSHAVFSCRHTDSYSASSCYFIVTNKSARKLRAFPCLHILYWLFLFITEVKEYIIIWTRRLLFVYSDLCYIKSCFLHT